MVESTWKAASSPGATRSETGSTVEAVSWTSAPSIPTTVTSLSARRLSPSVAKPSPDSTVASMKR